MFSQWGILVQLVMAYQTTNPTLMRNPIAQHHQRHHADFPLILEHI